MFSVGPVASSSASLEMTESSQFDRLDVRYRTVYFFFSKEPTLARLVSPNGRRRGPDLYAYEFDKYEGHQLRIPQEALQL